MKLDKTDRKILKELLTDGRAKYADIGDATGAGSSTIRWRIKRLEEEGIIVGYTCLPDTEYFGLNMAIFFIKTSGDSKEVINDLKKQGRLTSIVITFGDSNIVCRGVFEDIGDLLELKESISTIDGISEVQTCITHKGIGMGGEAPLELIRKTKRLDKTDARLLEELIKDARIGYTELGKKLKMNASTARLRTMKLVDEGVIRKFTARVDLAKRGQFPAFLRIKTDGGKTGEIISALGEIPVVVMALPCIGECDIFSRVIVKGAEDLNRLINDKIMEIDGIHDVKADCTLKGERIGGFLPPRMVETILGD
ncbi:Lrp/AsnC family transcriptional regulator [archaeon]|nr:Lrp/AsnC family transcriptional regulator [archaeon]